MFCMVIVSALQLKELHFVRVAYVDSIEVVRTSVYCQVGPEGLLDCEGSCLKCGLVLLIHL